MQNIKFVIGAEEFPKIILLYKKNHLNIWLPNLI